MPAMWKSKISAARWGALIWCFLEVRMCEAMVVEWVRLWEGYKAV